MCSKVLLAIPSYNERFYEDGSKTGLFVTEALHPFEVFKKAGFQVDIASETGSYGMDEHSLAPDFLNGEDLLKYEDKNSDFNLALNDIKKASEVESSNYKIIFFAAGHAAVFDYPKAKILQKISGEIYQRGGVVSAVCHGPAILDGLIDPTTGELLGKGKTITGFTDAGEEILGLDKLLKAKGAGSIEFFAKKVGAQFKHPDGPWVDYSVIDGRLVTGVNPASAASTAEKAIKVLESL